MKISKLFHWLYASVMMLPLFASIVFAIYTRNENSTFTQSVDYEINKVVNFNQLISNGRFDSLQGVNAVSCSVTLDNNALYIVPSSDSSYVGISFSAVQDHKYLLRYYAYSNTNTTIYTSWYGALSDSTNISTNVVQYSRVIDNPYASSSYWVIQFRKYDTQSYYLMNVNIFDLTDMFGIGNEPSISDFNTFYTDSYYVYNTGTQQLLKNYSTVTYNNTDVGSQLIYTLYNSTNNYFNVTNFIGLNNLYDWISFNVFNGTPALAFSLFYMLLSYWLLVSIFWLVFDVVMYVPNLAHRWLDKGSLQ